MMMLEPKRLPRTVTFGLAALLVGALGMTACHRATEPDPLVPVVNDVYQTRYPVNAYTEFADWDLDGNFRLSADEFRAGLDHLGTYGDWDQDDDGYVELDEFEAGLYTLWDVDSDRLIVEDEFGAGVNRWLAGQPLGGFAAWDTNADDFIDKGEFRAKIAEAEAFSLWDEDNNGLIEDEELATGIYRGLDANADGRLETNEFRST